MNLDSSGVFVCVCVRVCVCVCGNWFGMPIYRLKGHKGPLTACVFLSEYNVLVTR